MSDKPATSRKFRMQELGCVVQLTMQPTDDSIDLRSVGTLAELNGRCEVIRVAYIDMNNNHMSKGAQRDYFYEIKKVLTKSTINLYTNNVFFDGNDSLNSLFGISTNSQPFLMAMAHDKRVYDSLFTKVSGFVSRKHHWRHGDVYSIIPVDLKGKLNSKDHENILHHHASWPLRSEGNASSETFAVPVGDTMFSLLANHRRICFRVLETDEKTGEQHESSETWLFRGASVSLDQTLLSKGHPIKTFDLYGIPERFSPLSDKEATELRNQHANTMFAPKLSSSLTL